MLQIEVEVHNDLFAPGASNYAGADPEVARGHYPALGRVWIEAIEKSLPRDMEILRAARSGLLGEILGSTGPEADFSVWILYETGMAPGDRVRNYKRLWRSFSDPSELAGLSLSEELTLQEGGWVGFAGLAGGPMDQLPRLLAHADRSESPVLVSLARLLTTVADVAAVRDAYGSAPPPGARRRTNYLALASLLCPSGGAVIRPGSDFDQRSAWADLLLSPARIPPLAYELARRRIAPADL